MVRTLAFQVGNTSSILVQGTNFSSDYSLMAKICDIPDTMQVRILLVAKNGGSRGLRFCLASRMSRGVRYPRPPPESAVCRILPPSNKNLINNTYNNLWAARIMGLH